MLCVKEVPKSRCQLFRTYCGTLTHIPETLREEAEVRAAADRQIQRLNKIPPVFALHTLTAGR